MYDSSHMQGTPIDRNFQLLMLLASVYALIKRRPDWKHILSANSWLVAFFVFSGMSLLWSEYMFVGLKRWVKLGVHFAVMFVLFTQPSPFLALRTIMRRAAYVLLPFSILCIKYYRHIGVTYSPWGEGYIYAGVASGKNTLGALAAVTCVFFISNLLSMWQSRTIASDKKEALVDVFFISVSLSLLLLSRSKMSLGCFIAGLCCAFVLGRRFIKQHPGVVHGLLVLFLIVFPIAQVSFGVVQHVVGAFGKDMTLTGRVDLWADLLAMGTNPIIGCGYDNFWLGERMQVLWDKHWWQPTQAHNGYVEVYLELGLVGLLLLVGAIFLAYRKIIRMLAVDSEAARWYMAALAICILFNVTETAFKGNKLMFVTFLVVSFAVIPIEVSERPGTGRRKIRPELASVPHRNFF